MDDKEYQEWLNTRQGKWSTWIGVPAGFIVATLIIFVMWGFIGKVIGGIINWLF